MAASDNEKSRLDEAARAGWLYFIAGHTQDEIAKMLQVSRASAQRLVSLCLAERLITFRLEHPIAACMELAARLKDLFHLVYCEVVPTDPAAPLAAAGIAERAASILESTLRTEKPTIVALGTGRAVRAAVERVSPIDCPNHQIVSLVGNISADGSASFFDTVGRLAGAPSPAPTGFRAQGRRGGAGCTWIAPAAGGRRAPCGTGSPCGAPWTAPPAPIPTPRGGGFFPPFFSPCPSPPRSTRRS